MKKILMTVIAIVLMLVATSNLVSAGKAYTYGDVNENGCIDANDYMRLKRYILGSYDLSWFEFCKADANLDGVVDAKDYMTIKMIVLGRYEPKFPEQKAVAEMTDKELQTYINAMLTDFREEGRLYFEIESALDDRAVREVLHSVGLPEDFENHDMYAKVYTIGGYAFVLKIPENEIREVMFTLLRHEQVAYVSPCYYETPS